MQMGGYRNPQFQMARRRRRNFFIQLRIFSEHTRPQKKIRFHEEINKKKAVFENGEKVERAVAGWLWLLWLGGCGCCGWVVVAAVAGWLWPLWLGGGGCCGWMVVAAVWLGGGGCCGCCGCCVVEHGRGPENTKLVCQRSFVYSLVSKQTRTCHISVAKAWALWVLGMLGMLWLLRALWGCCGCCGDGV